MELLIRNLSKTYPNGTKALQSINLTITKGMFGLLGPNGAGKSTLMRTLATLQDPDEGEAILNGINIQQNPDEIRKVLGYLPQEFGVYPRINAEDLLNHLAVLHGVSNRAERKELVSYLLNRVNLWAVRKKKLGGYSGGMKQRFGIAQALLADPKLIIVDEPTAGLDPAERNRFLNLLAELGENKIIILSTHIVEDVTELCTSMAIIHEGKVKMQGNPEMAIEEIEGRVWEKHIEKAEMEEYKQKYTVLSSRITARKPVIHVFSDVQPDLSFEPVVPGLEDVYFSYILGTQKEKLEVQR